jgi:hypothetical protein
VWTRIVQESWNRWEQVTFSCRARTTAATASVGRKKRPHTEQGQERSKRRRDAWILWQSHTHSPPSGPCCSPQVEAVAAKMVKVSALSSGVTSGTAAAVKTPAASSAAEATTVVTTLQAEEGPGRTAAKGRKRDRSQLPGGGPWAWLYHSLRLSCRLPPQPPQLVRHHRLVVVDVLPSIRGTGRPLHRPSHQQQQHP